jgi:hypothetical protein
MQPQIPDGLAVGAGGVYCGVPLLAELLVVELWSVTAGEGVEPAGGAYVAGGTVRT